MLRIVVENWTALPRSIRKESVARRRKGTRQLEEECLASFFGGDDAASTPDEFVRVP
jgi:hypothetical protein